MEKPFILYLACSKLSHFEYCAKRSKLEIFGKVLAIEGDGKGAIARGNRLHFLYSLPNKGFDRLLLRFRLRFKTVNGKFRKQIDNIVVIGLYDDLRVLRKINLVGPNMGNTVKKFTSLIEVKTTSKGYMWSREVKAAIRQLQLYMWLLKDHLEQLGYPLWKRSYIEIYSQKNGVLLRRIPVEYDYTIENWIRYVVDCFKGLNPVSVPPFKFCKLCPRNVKQVCSWYQMRKEYYDKQK